MSKTVEIVCSYCGKIGLMKKPNNKWYDSKKHYPHKECLKKMLYEKCGIKRQKSIYEIPDSYEEKDASW